jgi:hypothetical protein
MDPNGVELMSPHTGVGLPEALERAASALGADADAIRPANGDPMRLIEELDGAAAVRVLTWLLENEPADGGELADAWAEAGDAGVEAVLGVGETALGKSGRKALRKTLHKLRSRGIESPAKDAAKPVVATLPKVEEELDLALVSPLDPRGSRAAYLVTAHPSGGARMFELLLDEEQGIDECRVYNTGRSKVRRFVRDFTRAGRFSAVEAPSDSVRALVARVASVHPPERPAPRSFSEWRSHVTGAPEGTLTPGELAREALGAEPDPVKVRQAADLVRKGAVGPWPPSADALSELGEKLSELKEGKIVLDADQRRAQAEKIVEDSLPRIFDAPFAERTAARFDEMAYVLWKNDREEDARICLAAAGAFRAGDVEENPVARAMLDVVVAPVLEQVVNEGTGDASEAPEVTS